LVWRAEMALIAPVPENGWLDLLGICESKHF
jgi:hypothetical protein